MLYLIFSARMCLYQQKTEKAAQKPLVVEDTSHTFTFHAFLQTCPKAIA